MWQRAEQCGPEICVQTEHNWNLWQSSADKHLWVCLRCCWCCRLLLQDLEYDRRLQ
jgi:hypothetical protein